MLSTLFIILCVLCALDVITTTLALKQKGMYELNPFLRPVMNKIGVLPTMLVGKALFLPLVFWFGMNIICLLLLDIVYLAVVINNSRLLYKFYREKP